ncbi:MAG: MerR family transcriptional regulator [Cyanobacteria bacterium]|nr:MerR family transcriptional regulator [Cyanobacteriota bacterium]
MAATKRELFKAAEVCEVVQVQPYVLRSWEAEFPKIGQGQGGQRLYRKADIELVLRIKQLVFEEGLTLSGARRRLEEDSEPQANGTGALVDEMFGDRVRERLKTVKSGLQSILEMLSKDGERQPELRLVAPTPAKKKTVAKGKGKK